MCLSEGGSKGYNYMCLSGDGATGIIIIIMCLSEDGAKGNIIICAYRRVVQRVSL